ncbi:hypothetical protein P7C71_g3488, partial [Lecanoromycetidae sp. Uapishka_2]
MGESYAGIYIPYFTQAILANPDKLKINLKSITIGDGTFGNAAAATDVVMTTYLHEQNSILNIPADLLAAYDQGDEKCGFTKVLQQGLAYPPAGKIQIPGNPEGENYRLKKRQLGHCVLLPDTPALVNESISLCNGGCATWTTALDYLSVTQSCFSAYNVKYNCANYPDGPDTSDFVAYLSLPTVRQAIHAPDKFYADCNQTVYNPLVLEQVEPPAYSIIPAILEAGIEAHFYSGDDDLFLNHFGTELSIQNMTWCGLQGLQKKPDNAQKIAAKLELDCKLGIFVKGKHQSNARTGASIQQRAVCEPSIQSSRLYASRGY